MKRLLMLVVVLAIGCGRVEKPEEPKSVADQGTVAVPPAKKVDDHTGYWCDEHGVPEHVCGRCSKDYKAECKKKGDWCKEHNRPDSQCFICHPEYAEKFIQMHVDKFGTKPPPREEEVFVPKASKRDRSYAVGTDVQVA